MMLAIVDDNVVTSIVTVPDSTYYNATAAGHQACIDIEATVPLPQVGWVFTGSALIPPPGYIRSMQITKLAFRERFTMTELVGILTAAATNPVLQVMQENIAVATFVDLNRPDTQAGVEYLVSLGILTQARATSILTTLPNSTETYQG